MQWIWIDRFTAFRRGEFARAVKELSLADELFADHFPEYPVMPAALMLEGLAQTGGMLVGEAHDYRRRVVLAKIAKVKFHGEALAGDELTYEATVLFIREEGAAIDGKVFANGRPLGEAELTFAHMDAARMPPELADQNFVFTGRLRPLMEMIARLQAAH
jgi:3-hydroxyacyl-[acyl-carrier-protein] dehydratase